MPSPWKLYGECYMNHLCPKDRLERTSGYTLPLVEAAQRTGLFAVVRRAGNGWAVWTITIEQWKEGVRP